MLAVEEEAWSADRMTFRVRALGQVAVGWVDVADDHVQFEVTLPWLLHKFAQVVQQTIAGRGRILLEKKMSFANAKRAAPDTASCTYAEALRRCNHFGPRSQSPSWFLRTASFRKVNRNNF